MQSFSRPAMALVALFSLAPLQCPSRQTPDLARDETPGDALWGLAQRFAAAGNEPARRATLGYLVERYPSSRWAPAARDALRQP